MLNLFANTVYVRIKPDQLALLHLQSGREAIEVPTVAIEINNGKTKVIAIGQEAIAQAQQPDIRLVNGCKHPRTIIADFNVAGQTLKSLLRRVLPKSLFSASPIVVIHPQAMLDGGLTQIEIRDRDPCPGGTGHRLGGAESLCMGRP